MTLEEGWMNTSGGNKGNSTGKERETNGKGMPFEAGINRIGEGRPER